MFKKNSYRLMVFLFSSLLTCTYAKSASLVHLQCEYMKNPLGIDAERPRLSWQMSDSREAAAQYAYQIFVDTDSGVVLHKTGHVWNSKKAKSASSLIVYRGPGLRPFTKYYWIVEVWNNRGEVLKSKVASFETGMMEITNWQGNWISDRNDETFKPAPYFRKVFQTGKVVRLARAYIAVGGLYELYINGNKVGNHRLDPMFTRFDRRNLYVTYDITSAIKSGKNAVGVLLGNGWYNHQAMAVWKFDKAPWRARPTFCLDIRISYTDGTSEVIASDNSWKTQSGPLVLNNIYTGEHYDARLDIPGWNTIDFDDKDWKPVALRAAPSNKIVSQAMPPIRNVELIPAKTMTKLNDTCYVFDLGRNIAGVSRIRLNGEAGTVVRLKHGERLQSDGHVDLSNIDIYYRPKNDQEPFATDIITLSGKGELEFMPKFNYKGFQYIEVTSNRNIQLKKEDLNGYFMHSDVQAVGEVQSSNPLLVNIWQAANNSYLSNLFGLPTDCPQREKNGWTGDGHFAIETGLYNFDGITIYEKWMADHRDEQQPNGVLPDIIPTSGWGYGTANGTDWTSSMVIIPWSLYQFYGDSKPLNDNYEAMKRYVGYIRKVSKGNLTKFGRGDWVPVKSKTPIEYSSSVYYFVDATILSKAAKILGRHKDEQYYNTLAGQIKNAINRKYLNAAKGIYGNGYQTEQSLALVWGIVPKSLQIKVAENLAKRVAADSMHLDVGVLGARAILNALSDNGQAETAYRLAVQNTYPSWGWWIENGATTLYENWNIKAARDISLNHIMFGDVGGWFIKGLGGIKTDEDNPGFKLIRLQPNFIRDLDHLEATFQSPYGLIETSWKRVDQKIYYHVVIPANSAAILNLPLKLGQRIIDNKNMPYLNNGHLTAGTYDFIVY
jgi:alpha-L-rhamnosidase